MLSLTFRREVYLKGGVVNDRGWNLEVDSEKQRQKRKSVRDPTRVA